MVTRSREVTEPDASAAWRSGIVASRSSNDLVGACARPDPTIEPISRATATAVASLAVDTSSSPLPERGVPGRDQLVVPDLSLQGADVAGEPADVGNQLLGDGRLVEGGVARDLVRDETRLLGGKQALRGRHRQRWIGTERALGFHDGADGPRGDVRMLPDQPLGGSERRE